MSLELLVSKYIASAEQVLKEIRRIENPISIDVQNIGKVIEYAKAYLEDAEYYRNKKKFETSLTSIAYCEGLLDTLKLLGAVKFEWSTKPKREE